MFIMINFPHFIFQEMLPSLLTLYSTALSSCSQEAYLALSSSTLHDLIGSDKLLDVLFGERSSTVKVFHFTLPRDEDNGKISMAKTLSCLTVDMKHCSVNDLYALANADSNEMCRRLNLGDGINSSSDSSESAESELGLGLGFGQQDNTSISGEAAVSGDYLEKCEAVAASCSDVQVEVGAVGGLSRNVENLTRISSDYIGGDANPQPEENTMEVLDLYFGPFRASLKKCVEAVSFLDKLRHIAHGVEDLNQHMSRLYGPNHISMSDDILTMLILALSHMPEDVFVLLYINIRLLIDVLPHFLSGTLWDYNLVSLYSAYDFLFSKKVCEIVTKKYPGSLRRSFSSF